jgi:hypothetical protein
VGIGLKRKYDGLAAGDGSGKNDDFCTRKKQIESNGYAEFMSTFVYLFLEAVLGRSTT